MAFELIVPIGAGWGEARVVIPQRPAVVQRSSCCDDHVDEYIAVVVVAVVFFVVVVDVFVDVFVIAR